MTQSLSYANRQQFETACGPRLEELGLVRFSSSQQIREEVANVNKKIDEVSQIINRSQVGSQKLKVTLSENEEIQRKTERKITEIKDTRDSIFISGVGALFLIPFVIGSTLTRILESIKTKGTWEEYNFFAKEADKFFLPSFVPGFLAIGASYLVGRTKLQELEEQERIVQAKIGGTKALINADLSIQETFAKQMQQLISKRNELLSFANAKNQIEQNEKRFKIVVLFSALFSKISGIFSGLFSKRKVA